MAASKKNTGSQAGQNLRGGTGGTGPAPNNSIPGGDPGGTNSIAPTGSARPAGHPTEPPTGDKAAAERQDPTRIDEWRTKPSPDVAAQRARDEADVSGSRSGIDENNPRQIPETAPTPDGRTGND